MPINLQIPLTAGAPAGVSRVILDLLSRRFRSGSLARVLLMSGQLSIALTVLVAGLALWLAGLASPLVFQLERKGREVRDGLIHAPP